jgi:chromosomal replication initiation ATPase DnaA
MVSSGNDAFVAAMMQYHPEKVSDKALKPKKPVIRDVINISSDPERRTENIERLEPRIALADTIITAVSYVSEFSISDLKSPRRQKKLARWRHICMYLLRKHTRNSLPWIGKKLGGRDHTTVMYAVRKIDEDYGTYAQDILDTERYL